MFLGAVGTITILTETKAPPGGEALVLVGLVENSLHPLVEELERWQSIIGEHYYAHKLEEERNRLAYRP